MENPAENKVVLDFITYYQSLSEGEKFKLGGYFNHTTGGKMSPYNSPTPVAVALIQVEDGDEIKILAVRRGIMPKIGELALPGGFVDQMEESNLAAVRETLEETGLVTHAEDYSVVGTPRITHNNNMLIFFKNKNVYPKSIMETLKLNSEVTEFALIDSNTPLAFPLHEEAVRDYFAPKEALSKKMTF
jgi:ADP-ribose pyrophosphatase YjhB (NUDIX family)